MNRNQEAREEWVGVKRDARAKMPEALWTAETFIFNLSRLRVTGRVWGIRGYQEVRNKGG